MLLQKLLWPRVGICTEDRLYYRMKAPSFRDEGDILRIEQGERVCFDTYFNSVSADKWRRYTAAQNFSLRLKLTKASKRSKYPLAAAISSTARACAPCWPKK